eukprot:g78091.t1
MEELEECLEKTHFGKAYETRNEMFECGGVTLRQLLLRVFNFLRDIETTPDDWGMGHLSTSTKTGTQLTWGTIEASALVWLHGRETVRGTRGFSSEPVHNGPDNLMARGSRLAKRSTYLFFVDFQKAFDTLWQDDLWQGLWQSGIRGRAWRIIRDVYRGIHMRVLVDGCLTQPVPVPQGVRQGDPLSPVLILIFIDALAEMLAEQCKRLA